MSATDSVAGEAEQVPTVVDVLVDHAAGEERRRALVQPDQVKEGEQQRAAEDRPGQDLADRDGGGDGGVQGETAAACAMSNPSDDI